MWVDEIFLNVRKRFCIDLKIQYMTDVADVHNLFLQLLMDSVVRVDAFIMVTYVGCIQSIKLK